MLFITYPSNDTLAEDFLLSQLYQQNQGLTVSLDVIFERQTECTCDNCYNNLLMYFFSGAGERLTLELEKSVHLQIFLTDTLSVMIRHFTPSYLQLQAPVYICLSLSWIQPSYFQIQTPPDALSHVYLFNHSLFVF